MNIVQYCIQSMRVFDLMDMTWLFLVCMGYIINIENMLLLWKV